MAGLFSKSGLFYEAGSNGGGGGSDPHNLGWYETPTALSTAHPTAVAGDWAIVGSTDTVWVWDTDTSAWVDTDTKGQVTSVNNQTGAVTVQETLVNQTNIKSVNGNSLLGSGNLELTSSLAFPAGWTTNSTTKALCDDVAADSSAVAGKMYLGEVTCSDLPASISNSEIKVEIVDGTTAQTKVILLELTSGNVSPYRWQYTYWNGGSNVSGWKTWQEELVSGTNIKTVNNTSLLGSGNITIDSLPAQTGQSGKFLTTDGSTASWSDKPLINKNAGYDQAILIAPFSTYSYTLYSNSVIISTAGFMNPSTTNYAQTAVGGGLDSLSGWGATMFGSQTKATGTCAVAIGALSKSTANYAIQLGCTGSATTNPDANTFKVANANGNFEIMSADGTIPTDRFTTTPVADGTYIPTLTISSGTATRTWGAPASGLPTQTGHSGEFLTTDGTDASWATISALQNTATGTGGLTILGSVATGQGVNIGTESKVGSGGGVIIGYQANKSGAANPNGVAIGYGATLNGSGRVAIGFGATAGNYGIAIGDYAIVSGQHGLQIGSGTNNEAGTFYWGTYYNGSDVNYKIVDADGTIPKERLADTTSATAGQVLTLDNNLNATWTTPSGGGSVPTLTWYTVSSAGTTLTIADTSSAQLVKVYKNGLLLQPTEDYTISGTTLTTVAALVVGDKITTEVF